MSQELLQQVPMLAAVARLRFDRHGPGFVLLSPERCLRLNDSAAEIVRRCDGHTSVGEIAGAVAQHVASLAEATQQVVELLYALRDRRLLTLRAGV